MARKSVTVRELRESIDVSKLGPNSPLHEILKKGNRARPRDLEHRAQVKVFDWVRTQELQHPEFARVFAVPNFSGRQGRRTARHSARLTAEGRRRGVPDILWPLARCTRRNVVNAGLALELKIEPNKPTEEQHEWIDFLRSQGWRVAVCSGTDPDEAAGIAIAQLQAYWELAS